MSIAVSNDASGTKEIPVPQGARLPAILVDLNQATPQQMSAADTMAASFLQRAAGDTAPPGKTPATNGAANQSAKPETSPSEAPPAAQNPSDVATANWDAARKTADEKYRSMFGQDSFNRQNTTAGAQVLESSPR